jgi:transposase
MAPLILSSRQRSEWEYRATHNPAAKERCRAQALLWLEEGETAEPVAESLRLSRRTLSSWRERLRDRDELDLRQRGADAPRPGRPRKGGIRVDPGIADVVATDPRALGSHQTVWTAPRRGRYLRDHHEVEVSRQTVRRALARLGLRWQRPRHQLARRPDPWRQSQGGGTAAGRAASAPCC